MKSPIKYFGGKGSFANKLIEYFPKDYQSMEYIEPFSGSAALLFHKEKSPIEIINDIDENIICLFKVLIDSDKFKKFKEMCDVTPYSEQLNREYLRDLNSDLDLIERAYKYFYVNRTSFSGSLGGISKSSVIRRNMSKSVSDYLSSIDGLYDVHNRLSSVIILNRDALKLIKDYDREGVFIYSDSPYANETRSSGSYKHDFTDEDQDKYLNVLINIKSAKIMVSGYNCDRYSILEKSGFKRFDMVIKGQNNNIQGKSKVESIWINY